jgi:hypothetical protein
MKDSESTISITSNIASLNNYIENKSQIKLDLPTCYL